VKKRLDWATRILRRALPSRLQTVALDVCTNADAAAFENWKRYRGMAVAETVYPDSAARHCHDLDLLLPIEQIEDASAIFSESGYRTATHAGASASSRWHVHSSKFPVALHSVPFRIHSWNSDSRTIMGRSRGASIAGCDVRILSAEDTLVQVCCSGLTAGRRHSPCWPADAWFLIARSGANFDWDAFVAAARASERAPAVRIALEYLKTELRTPIPVAVLEQLRVTRTGAAAIEAMAAAALLSNYGRRLGLIRRSGNPADMARTTVWAMRARLDPT